MSLTRIRRSAVMLPLLLTTVLSGCGAEFTVPQAQAQAQAQAQPLPAVAAGRVFPVAGSAVHFFTTAAVHSEAPTETGVVKRSTEIIRLTGDLDGYILYRPVSAFDFAAGTLVNTGTQLFSGTVAGSAPVLLHDDSFRFTVDLATGATTGKVHLSRSRDASDPGSWFECHLEVVGTGLTPDGDGLADYSGTCTERGRPG